MKEQEKVLVMDIHSHGRFHAFFSSVDNHDEKGVRLYMVIGNLDRHKHTYALRAGMAGSFGTLDLSEIFSQEKTPEERKDPIYVSIIIKEYLGKRRT